MTEDEQELVDSECPHCHVESIREAKVTDVERGWENDPPSLDDFGAARICYICLCGWTVAGEFSRRGPSCNGGDREERTR